MSLYPPSIFDQDEIEVFDDELGETVRIKWGRVEPVYDPRCHQGSFAEFERGGMAGEPQALAARGAKG